MQTRQRSLVLELDFAIGWFAARKCAFLAPLAEMVICLRLIVGLEKLDWGKS